MHVMVIVVGRQWLPPTGGSLQGQSVPESWGRKTWVGTSESHGDERVEARGCKALESQSTFLNVCHMK